MGKIGKRRPFVEGEDEFKDIEVTKGRLSVSNLTDRDLIERQTVLLELISLKLNCLQVDEITEDDIET